MIPRVLKQWQFILAMLTMAAGFGGLLYQSKETDRRTLRLEQKIEHQSDMVGRLDERVKNIDSRTGDMSRRLDRMVSRNFSGGWTTDQ